MPSAQRSWIALLRAVNVGGTGTLAMADLRRLAVEAGFADARTHITSGNLVFSSGQDETDIRQKLETALLDHMRKPVPVLVRSGADIADVIIRNPFADLAGSRTLVLFTDEAIAPDLIDRATGRKEERIEPGLREIYIHYGEGMAGSKLRLPQQKAGTARNINTLTRLAAMASEQVPLS